MLKRMLNKLIIWATREAGPTPPTPVYAQDVLAGSELVMVAYKIDNGYLLRLTAGSNSIGMSATLVYCVDEDDIAKQVVAHRAKIALGVTKSHPRYGVNPVYTGAAQATITNGSI